MAREGRKRGGGRSARIAARQSNVAQTISFIERKIPYFEVLNDEALALIEYNAETVLEEIGIEFRDYPSALSLLKNAGADVDNERVRFPRGLCRQLLTTAPSEYTQHARNSKRSTIIGGDRTVLVPAYGSPFIRNAEEARR